MPRIAVIGDVAGHLEELRAELRRLGADPDGGRLPADLTVVQVGDLVHRGPASDEVVTLVDRFLTADPDRWIQLVGNHEAQYLAEPAFEWPERVDARSRATLRRWWADGLMRAATWVAAGTEQLLITHSGITHGFWAETLGGPSTAERTAGILNSFAGAHDDVLFRAGVMLRGRGWGSGSGRRTTEPGPIWACAGTELTPSWLDRGMPFSQAHGHDSVYDWSRRGFRAPREVAELTTVDEQAKHEVTALSGGRIVGVDPGHGGSPRRPWRAWVLEDQAEPGVGGSGSL
jgi:hypothetical protein